MDEGQAEETLAQLVRVLASGKEFFYWLGPKGEDGEPVLLVERTQGPLRKAAQLARAAARTKSYARGRVFAGEDGFVFANEGDLADAKAERVCKTELAMGPHFKRVAGALRKATFHPVPAYEQLRNAAGIGAAADLEEDEAEGGSPPSEEGAELEEKRKRADALAERAHDVLGAQHEVTGWLTRGLAKAGEHRANHALALEESVLDRLLAEGRTRLDTALGTAWTEQTKRIGELYRKAVAELESRGDGAAVQELARLRGEVNELKKAGKLGASLDRLVQLEAACEEALAPRPQGGPEVERDGDEEQDEDEDEDPDEALRRQAEDALDEAQEVAAELGNPRSLAGLLAEAWGAFDDADWTEALRVLEGPFADAVARRREIGLKRLAQARLQLLADLRLARAEIDRYVAVVGKDGEVARSPDAEDLLKELASLRDTFLPRSADDLAGLMDKAINAAGDARADAVDEVVEAATGLAAEVTLLRGTAPFEKSSFGEFRVHEHLLATFDHIRAACRGRGEGA